MNEKQIVIINLSWTQGALLLNTLVPNDFAGQFIVNDVNVEENKEMT